MNPPTDEMRRPDEPPEIETARAQSPRDVVLRPCETYAEYDERGLETVHQTLDPERS